MYVRTPPPQTTPTKHLLTLAFDQVMNLFRRVICESVYPKLLKPYRPTPIPVDYIKDVLFPFNAEYKQFPTGEDMWEDFVKTKQFVFVPGSSQDLDTKKCLANFSKVQEEQSHNPGFS